MRVAPYRQVGQPRLFLARVSPRCQPQSFLRAAQETRPDFPRPAERRFPQPQTPAPDMCAPRSHQFRQGVQRAAHGGFAQAIALRLHPLAQSRDYRLLVNTLRPPVRQVRDNHLHRVRAHVYARVQLPISIDDFRSAGALSSATVYRIPSSLMRVLRVANGFGLPAQGIQAVAGFGQVFGQAGLRFAIQFGQARASASASLQAPNAAQGAFLIFLVRPALMPAARRALRRQTAPVRAAGGRENPARTGWSAARPFLPRGLHFQPP